LFKEKAPADSALLPWSVISRVKIPRLFAGSKSPA
jgi:hypothetical protein